MCVKSRGGCVLADDGSVQCVAAAANGDEDANDED